MAYPAVALFLLLPAAWIRTAGLTFWIWRHKDAICELGAVGRTGRIVPCQFVCFNED